MRVHHAKDWCNSGIQTLNELSGFKFSDPPTVPQNLCQSQALDSFRDTYRQVPPPPSDASPAGAFHELCGLPTQYEPVVAASTATYTKELVSWPPSESVAV